MKVVNVNLLSLTLNLSVPLYEYGSRMHNGYMWSCLDDELLSNSLPAAQIILLNEELGR